MGNTIDIFIEHFKNVSFAFIAMTELYLNIKFLVN